MATVRQVQNKIKKIEGFDVIITYEDGKDVRDDKGGFTRYPFAKACRNSFSVGEWKNKRFSQHYPGYGIKVLWADGTQVRGNTKLATVRDTYLED